MIFKRLITIFKDNVQKNLVSYICLLLTLIGGIIFGVFISVYTSSDEATLMVQILNDSINQLAINGLSFSKIGSIFISNLRFIILSFIFSINIFLIPLLYLQIFLKGISIGLTTLFLISFFQATGWLISLFAIIFDMILIIPIIFYMANICINRSLKRREFLNTSNFISLKVLNKKIYTKLILVFLILTKIMILKEYLLIKLLSIKF